MDRKLASIQRIVSTEDIVFDNEQGNPETAANIIKATILGWHCVTQRSNGFKPDDLVIYFEIDSLIPLTPEVEFLRKTAEQTHARIKTMKFKGQYAQGLILPISAFKDHPKYADIMADVSEDRDLTELLGVNKYEAPESNSGGPNACLGGSSGNFPSYLAEKTDETRIQAAPRILTTYKGKEFYVTEKLDGSSCTVFYYPVSCGLPIPADQPEDKDYVFGVCSRNFMLRRDGEKNAFWSTVNDTDLEARLVARGLPTVLQGELVGPGVQKNKLKLPKLDLYWFNVYHPYVKSYADFADFEEIVLGLGQKTVPILDRNFILDHTVDELVAYSTGKSQLATGVFREGVVLRPKTECTMHRFGRLSFKVISPEFLMKFDA